MKQESITQGTREQIAKVKLEVIEKSLHFNPKNPRLMKIYLETLPKVYSCEQVKKIIEDFISKDLNNFNLWKELIKNHQRSISGDAENTMKLFRKCMNTIKCKSDSDQQSIVIFKSFCLFLRQCGLNEQFFAAISLAINLNITPSDELKSIFNAKETQNPLLNEFEDLVLKSNIPFNELWFRMEILRSVCNFLPVRDVEDQMVDPQRYVFDDDINEYVSPLINPKLYSFDLFIVILKLLKLPFSLRHMKNEMFIVEDQEIECAMDFLPILLEKRFNSESFDKIMYIIAKDLNIPPNYTNFNIENQEYFELVSKILLLSCNSFNDRQNKIVLLLWLRFQRLAVIMDQIKMQVEDSKIDQTKYKKQIKSKVKNALKNSKFQNDLQIFKEYALIEKSLGDTKSCQNILEMAISSATSNHDEVDFYSVVLEFCEQKIIENDKNSCLEKLKMFSGANLEVLAFFDEKILMDEYDEDSSDIEDYLLPKSNKMNFIKAKVYHILCTKSKRDALNEISDQIGKSFGVLKEKLYEFFVWIYLLRWQSENLQQKILINTVIEALEQFPHNIFIIHSIASHETLRWFDVRKLLIKTPTIESIFYLLLASKFHEDNLSSEENTKIYKHRIYNIIDRIATHPGVSSILIWRIYLRTAFSYDFSKCKRILFETLDNNPMIKQLYLDGARYLPEEHSQLLDLIVEKGLRAHALAEELEILRTQSIN